MYFPIEKHLVKISSLALLVDSLLSLAKVLLTVKHMQTDGKIFLRIHKTATMGDVRAKIMEVLDLPRSAFGSPRGW